MELIHTVQRIREVGDSPDSAGTDDAERNEIRRYRVAHAVAPWTASSLVWMEHPACSSHPKALGIKI